MAATSWVVVRIADCSRASAILRHACDKSLALQVYVRHISWYCSAMLPT